MSSISKVLVSGYSESFFMFDFNTTSGRAGVVTKQDSDKNLSFTAFDKHKGNLYCVHEITDYKEVKNPPNLPESTHTGAVSRWKLNKNGVFERKEVSFLYVKASNKISLCLNDTRPWPVSGRFVPKTFRTKTFRSQDVSYQDVSYPNSGRFVPSQDVSFPT